MITNEFHGMYRYVFWIEVKSDLFTMVSLSVG